MHKSSLVRGVLAPVIAALGVLCAIALMVYPVLGMNPHDIPVAIVNLDRGMETPDGDINAGDAAMENIQNAGDGAISWITVNSADEAADGIEDGTYYASFVIPEDFTSTSEQAQEASIEGAKASAAKAATAEVMEKAGADAQANPAAVQAAAEKAAKQAAEQAGKAAEEAVSKIEPSPAMIVINEGKNPMVAKILTSAFATMADESDMPVTTEVHNALPSEAGTAGTILPIIVMLMTCLTAFASSVLIRRVFPIEHKGVSAAINQVLLAAIVSLIGGYTTAWLVQTMTGLDLSVATLGLFTSMAGFAIALLTLGCVNLLGTKGMAIPGFCLILGAIPSLLGPYLVPSFWRDFIYFWVPVRFVTEGAKAVLFQGAGAWNESCYGLGIVAIIGIALIAISVAVLVAKDGKEGQRVVRGMVRPTPASN